MVVGMAASTLPAGAIVGAAAVNELLVGWRRSLQDDARVAEPAAAAAS